MAARNSSKRVGAAFTAVLCLAATAQLRAEAVRAKVELVRTTQKNHPPRKAAVSDGVVVWLTPLHTNAPSAIVPQHSFKLVQKDRQFTPHLLVLPIGSVVDFPNLDPFFHNVFSLFNGKRFDLGLYEAHTNRTVRFDREGVSYIFCNIHPQMGAVVVALSTPFYATSQSDGSVFIPDVPPGTYRLHVWAENVSVEQLSSLERDVLIDDMHVQLPEIHLKVSGDLMEQHQNKFGSEYPQDPRPMY